MKKITIIILSIFIPCFFNTATAQSKLYGGSGGFYLGPKFYNTSNYEYFLPSQGNLENNLITIGGGGYGIYKNWMLGGYGFFRSGNDEELAIGDPNQDANYYNYQLTGGGGYLTLGYVVFHTQKSILFPQLGIGLEAMSIAKRTDNDVPFQTAQLLSAEYRWGAPMMDLAIGYDFFPGNKHGVKIGVRLGYNLSLAENNNWYHNGGELTGTNLPDNNLNGFYLNLVIGGGKIIEK